MPDFSFDLLRSGKTPPAGIGGVCLALLVLVPLMLGMSSPRRFEAGPLNSPNLNKVTFSDRQSSERVFSTPVAEALDGRWSGDGMSRLVLYTWVNEDMNMSRAPGEEEWFVGEDFEIEYTDEKYYGDDEELESDHELDDSEYTDFDTEALQPFAASSGGPVYLAYDVPWSVDVFGRLGDANRVIRAPRPCVVRNGVERCGEWRRARNVDLGRCSIELPYGDRGVLTPRILRDAGLGTNFSLGRELLNGVLAELEGAWSGTKKGVFARVWFRPSYEDSYWYIDPLGEELCIVAKMNMTQMPARLLRAIPVSRMCVNGAMTLKVCGNIELASVGNPVWSTSSVSFSPNNHRKCARRVVDGIEDNIASLLEEPLDNPITNSLRESLSSSFSFNRKSLSKINPALQIFVRPSCDNPAPFPGNRNDDCFISLLEGVRGRCVLTDKGGGECYSEMPIVRVESTPAGVELILDDHHEVGGHAVNANWIFDFLRNLESLLAGFTGLSEKLGVLSLIRAEHCVSGSDADPRDIRTSSRYTERIWRGRLWTVVGGEK